jgi:deoxyribodipyrimidine photolyase
MTMNVGNDREIASRLSPHIRIGEISPRQIRYAAHVAVAKHPELRGNICKLFRRLGWRAFCRALGVRCSLFDHARSAIFLR